MPPAVSSLFKAARSRAASPAKLSDVLGVLIATLTLCVTLGGSALHREREWTQLKAKVDALSGSASQLDRIERGVAELRQGQADVVRELATEREERRLSLRRVR